MFKIGINSASRIITPEVTETQEGQQQSVQQIAPSQAESVSAASSSIRSEAMFSKMAMREQLSQQLARNESMKPNPLDRQSDRIQKQILEMEQAINAAEMHDSDSSTSKANRDRAHDNILAFLDILRNMDPKI